jgi:hypothetical protein
MDGPGPDLNDFSTAVADAQAELARAIQLAGLESDPIGHAFRGLSTVIGLFPEFVANIAVTRQPLNEEYVLRKIVAGVSEKNAEMAVGEVARAVERLVLQRNRWAMIIAAGAVVLSLAAGAGGGYWQGHRDGYADGAALGLQANAVIGSMPTAEGLAWEQLIRDNPVIANSLAECRKLAQPQNGRASCDLPIWAGPPQPPPTHH